MGVRGGWIWPRSSHRRSRCFPGRLSLGACQYDGGSQRERLSRVLQELANQVLAIVARRGREPGEGINNGSLPALARDDTFTYAQTDGTSCPISLEQIFMRVFVVGRWKNTSEGILSYESDVRCLTSTIFKKTSIRTGKFTWEIKSSAVTIRVLLACTERERERNIIISVIRF